MTATHDRLANDLLDIANTLVAGQATTVRHAAAVLAALAADHRVIVEAVGKVVEPFGYDVDAACGPADLLPGLEQVAVALRAYLAINALPVGTRFTLAEWDRRHDALKDAFEPAIALARIRAVRDDD